MDNTQIYGDDMIRGQRAGAERMVTTSSSCDSAQIDGCHNILISHKACTAKYSNLTELLATQDSGHASEIVVYWVNKT